MSRYTRREFLATSSAALAGLAVGARTLGAAGISGRILPASDVQQFLVDRPSPSEFQLLAAAAIDSARAAGATYADVRVGDALHYRVGAGFPPYIPGVGLSARFAYGIRVCVNGTWSFVHGTIPNVDHITTSARNAVAAARGNGRAGLIPPRTEFTPAPAVTGTWASQSKIDPFSIPAEEQLALIDACSNALGHVLGGQNGGVPEWGGLRFQWFRETRVFASTEGSMITQTFNRSHPVLAVSGERGMGWASLQTPHFVAQSGGYETVLDPALQDNMKAASEEAVRFASIPRTTMDVGRYPVVFDGFATSKVFCTTMGPALELDRILGYEADGAGTSLFAPYQETLGVPLFSPKLNVSADRKLPTFQAARWDDEGVEPGEYTLIRNGTVVDFHTSRQTAPMMREWYERQGMSYRSNGCATATETSDPVAVRAQHMTIAHGSASAPLDDLYKDMSHGIVVRETGWSTMVDQQFASGTVANTVMLEIRNGKIVSRLRDVMLNYSTRNLWKNIDAIGDEGTVRTSDSNVLKGQPWVRGTQSVTAPAMLFKQINVVSTVR